MVYDPKAETDSCCFLIACMIPSPSGQSKKAVWHFVGARGRLRDIRSTIEGTPWKLLGVNLSIWPRKTVPDIITYGAANPGKISMASYGTGTASHLAGELFKTMAGVNMIHVPYRGEAPALTDLLGGQVQVFFGSSGSIEPVKSGRLRALAVTTAGRSVALPDIPTVSDFVPGYEASAWVGVGVPRGTPREITERLNRERDWRTRPSRRGSQN
jgi:hypothetical protein